MTDHPRRRFGDEPAQEPAAPDPVGPGAAFPEQPSGPAAQAQLMKGEAEENAAAAPDPDGVEDEAAADIRQARSGS